MWRNSKLKQVNVIYALSMTSTDPGKDFVSSPPKLKFLCEYAICTNFNIEHNIDSCAC